MKSGYPASGLQGVVATLIGVHSIEMKPQNKTDLPFIHRIEGNRMCKMELLLQSHVNLVNSLRNIIKIPVSGHQINKIDLCSPCSLCAFAFVWIWFGRQNYITLMSC